MSKIIITSTQQESQLNTEIETHIETQLETQLETKFTPHQKMNQPTVLFIKKNSAILSIQNI